MKLIYCVEDDTDIKELIEYTLGASGFSVMGFENAAAFWNGMKTRKPSLVLLDIMLPDEDGMQILKKLKANIDTAAIPTIMLTAKSGQIDKIKALDGGADDYVTKPFDVPELVSRINAVLRRYDRKPEQKELRYKELTLYENSRKVTVGDAEVVLTYKEFELLGQLVRNQGFVMTREKLMVNVWGTDFTGESRTVDVHIRTLRQKLGDAGSYIETVRNVGYKVG